MKALLYRFGSIEPRSSFCVGRFATADDGVSSHGHERKRGRRGLHGPLQPGRRKCRKPQTGVFAPRPTPPATPEPEAVHVSRRPQLLVGHHDQRTVPGSQLIRLHIDVLDAADGSNQRSRHRTHSAESPHLLCRDALLAERAASVQASLTSRDIPARWPRRGSHLPICRLCSSEVSSNDLEARRVTCARPLVLLALGKNTSRKSTLAHAGIQSRSDSLFATRSYEGADRECATGSPGCRTAGRLWRPEAPHNTAEPSCHRVSPSRRTRQNGPLACSSWRSSPVMRVPSPGHQLRPARPLPERA
jgi:hypothetical protein